MNECCSFFSMVKMSLGIKRKKKKNIPEEYSKEVFYKIEWIFCCSFLDILSDTDVSTHNVNETKRKKTNWFSKERKKKTLSFVDMHVWCFDPNQMYRYFIFVKTRKMKWLDLQQQRQQQIFVLVDNNKKVCFFHYLKKTTTTKTCVIFFFQFYSQNLCM